MVPLILAHLEEIEFESCKQIVELFAHILRKPARPFNPMVRYLLEHPEILDTLLRGYYTSETAIHFGAVGSFSFTFSLCWYIFLDFARCL